MSEKIASGYAFTVDEIFYNFERKKIKTSTKERLNVVHGETDKTFFIRKIFCTSVEIILNDIVNNNVTFWLPVTNKIKACLKVDRISNDTCIKLRKKGVMPDLNLLETGFSIPLVTFHMIGWTVDRWKSVYIPKGLQQVLVEKANAGFLYGDGKVDTYFEDYISKVCEIYPNVLRSDVKKILRYGWRSLYKHCSYGGDIKIKYKNFLCFIGNVYADPRKLFIYYLVKVRRKLRIMFKKKRLQWDGYYYFSIDKELYEKYLKTKNFENIRLFKIFEECSISSVNEAYIFKTTLKEETGCFKILKLFFDGECELILHRPSLKFKDIMVSTRKYETLNIKIPYAKRKRD